MHPFLIQVLTITSLILLIRSGIQLARKSGLPIWAPHKNGYNNENQIRVMSFIHSLVFFILMCILWVKNTGRFEAFDLRLLLTGSVVLLIMATIALLLMEKKQRNF